MVKISKTEYDQDADRYPDRDFLNDFADYDFASFISTIQVEAVIGQKVRTLGDSDVCIMLEPTGNTGKDGIKEIKQTARELLKLSKEAIPKMSKKYANFYQHFVDDFEQNGLNMPIYGKILTNQEEQ